MSELAQHSPADAVQMMDAMYRYTRHVYDASRKFYLLGRDQLIDHVQLAPGEIALEVGCGTARNLIKLHRRFPTNRLYGLDAATVMLETASQSLRKSGALAQVQLRHCLAEQLSYRQTFGLDRPFDLIFFSYSLSMIPTWRESLDVALDNLRPGGAILIVDFWDQADLPAWFAALLRRWLSLFHVHYRPELHTRLNELAASGRVSLELTSIRRRYAYLATLRKLP
jgi:S-adenosylmethionine-diacylgycerolhomoserine-N-methlytransferase